MPESRRSLNDILQELHDTLEASPDLDHDAREELRAAASDIREALDAEGESEDDSLTDRLNRALERFEGEHPKLTELVGRVADALADIGI